MAATPRCCVEMVRGGDELLGERADSEEGWLSDGQLDWDGDHAAAYHFSDGGNGGHDGCLFFVFGGRLLLPLKRN